MRRAQRVAPVREVVLATTLRPEDELLVRAARKLGVRCVRGSDVDVLSRYALAAREAKADTMHVYRNPERFALRSVVDPNAPDASADRWTLDTLDDYRMLATLFDLLSAEAAEAPMERVLAVLDAHPEVRAMNAHIEQKKT